MDGFLDHLSPASVLHKRQWKRRYFRLDAAFRALEAFSDEAMHERKSRIDLCGAMVATMDELGGLLSVGSAKISVENSRRFVIRVSELDAAKKPRAHHFLCAEVVGSTGAVNAQASRVYLQQWLRALQRVAVHGSAADTLTQDNALGILHLSELSSNSVAAFMDRMHVTARITGRAIADKKSVFELTVKAWILQRELVEGGGGDNVASSWQILEYACSWKTQKSSAQLRDFDAQLRQFYRSELRDVAAPPTGSALSPGRAIQHLLHSAAHADAETQRRVAATDAYWQQLLCLPAFSAFGSDGSALLDTFLDITPHFASFRQIEKASGQSMHLRRRNVVPWSEREKFERLYRMHLDTAKASEPDGSVSVFRHSDAEARRSNSKHHHHEHHHGSKMHTKDRGCEDAVAQASDELATSASDSVRAASIVEVLLATPTFVVLLFQYSLIFVDANLLQDATASVHARIAKIGKKLISEAFLAPSLRSEPHAAQHEDRTWEQ